MAPPPHMRTRERSDPAGIVQLLMCADDDAAIRTVLSQALTRALSAITALQLGLDHTQPLATALTALFEGARQQVLDSVIRFDAAKLGRLKDDITEIAGAFRAAPVAGD